MGLRAAHLVAFLAACQPAVKPEGSGGSPAPTAAPEPAPPSTTPPTEATAMSQTTVQGRIEAIRLHDINKAQGHHTYNVELVVRGTIDGAWRFPGTKPEVVTVRVAKIYFDRIDDATKAALAPDGPKPELTPARYETWSVGDDVTLSVEMTSPDLGHLR